MARKKSTYNVHTVYFFCKEMILFLIYFGNDLQVFSSIFRFTGYRGNVFAKKFLAHGTISKKGKKRVSQLINSIFTPNAFYFFNLIKGHEELLLCISIEIYFSLLG